MTAFEMTPEKWSMLGWLFFGLAFLWCLGLFIRSLWKNDDDKRPGDGVDRNW